MKRAFLLLLSIYLLISCAGTQQGGLTLYGEVRTIKAKTAQLTTERIETLLPDGEIFGKTPTDINILPKKLNYFYLQ